MIASQLKQENRADADNNKDNDSSVDGEDYNRFTFATSIHVDALALENRM